MIRITPAAVVFTAFGLVAPAAAAQEWASSTGAKLRVLDKLTNQITDLDLSNGQSAPVGKITVLLDECRYPAGNQTAEAEAHVTIVDAASSTPAFAGWMIASSPALSALDHPRYDVWVLQCEGADLAIPEVAPLPEEGEADAPTEGGDQPAEDDATDAGDGQ